MANIMRWDARLASFVAVPYNSSQPIRKGLSPRKSVFKESYQCENGPNGD